MRLKPEQAKVGVISAEAAFIATDALQGALSSGDGHISIPGQQIGGIAGETRTGQQALFAGFTKGYTGAFCFGYDYLAFEGTQLYINESAIGEKGPGRFWEKVFRAFYEEMGLPNSDLPPKPENVITALIDTVSGKVPTELSYADPRGPQIASGYFIHGTEPSEPDDMHVLVSICPESALLAGSRCPAEDKVLIDKDPGKLCPSGIMPISPPFVPSWEAGAIKPTARCGIH